LPDGSLVADFGCGSCGLTLPLAWAFPNLRFCGIDIKGQALELMTARALSAGLENVQTHCGSVASFTQPIELAIALHACGQASDEAMMQVRAKRALKKRGANNRGKCERARQPTRRERQQFFCSRSGQEGARAKRARQRSCCPSLA
jgi:hypothetical protein